MFESEPDRYDTYPVDANIDSPDNTGQSPLPEDGYYDHGIYPQLEADQDLSNFPLANTDQEDTTAAYSDYHVRINAPGEPRELTPQESRHMEIEEQLESAYWHIIHNPDEDFSLDVDRSELADRPDDQPVRLVFDWQNTPHNIIPARSLGELKDIAFAAIKKLSSTNTVSDVQNRLVTENVHHEISHIAGFEGIGAAVEDVHSGLWISRRPGRIIGNPSGKLSDYGDMFDVCPFVAPTHFETTKLGNAVATVAPVARNFSLPGNAEQFLSNGDVKLLNSMGYTSFSDIAARIAAYNDSHPKQPLPSLDFNI
jgi:hypothetical protein